MADPPRPDRANSPGHCSGLAGQIALVVFLRNVPGIALA
jgi:hypothetical protein